MSYDFDKLDEELSDEDDPRRTIEIKGTDADFHALSVALDDQIKRMDRIVKNVPKKHRHLGVATMKKAAKTTAAQLRALKVQIDEKRTPTSNER